MRRPGRWLEIGLTVVGLTVLLAGVTRGVMPALLAAAGGVLVALAVTLRSAVASWRGDTVGPAPTDFGHIAELLCRAHAARAGWAVGLEGGLLEVVTQQQVPEAALQRGAALVELASVDGRTHVAREPEGTYVAVGDFPYGAGLLLAQATSVREIPEIVTHDLRRLVAAMSFAEEDTAAEQGTLVAKRLALKAAGTQTLEGVARAGAELAEQIAQHGAAVVIADPGTLDARVIAISPSGDQRLAGVFLDPESPVARAIRSGVPIVTEGAQDVFGPRVPERRRQERAGTAYPLNDGHLVVGALVVVGPAIRADTTLADQMGRLVAELGPRVSAARAVHLAEQRAVRDPLTGLVNRRELERQMEAFRTRQQERVKTEPATLVYVDLDFFKRLNDTHGHPAGDSALRHVAAVLTKQVRDGDVVARIGGEEFAIWLPGTPLNEGLEVADRMRRAVADGTWHWSGTAVPLTMSCGVAAYPESVGDVKNLQVAADAALYRAKQQGRNRVERANPY